jgi:predicted LPLAT superfamily acyltransferase
MAEWEGKSKGTPLGYRIFVAILNNIGLYPAYLLLVFVAFYYFLFSFKTSKPSYLFFRKRCGYGMLRATGMVYWSYFLLGQSLIDKVAVMAGLSDKYTSTSNGSENIKHMAEMKRGAIMIGAHLGNWEIAGHFISRYDTVVNILIYDGEHEQIKQYMDSVTGGKKFNIIPIKSNLSHVYLMSEALMRGETICLHADRFLKGNRTKAISFMGEEAPFPMGPFQLIKSLKAPYTFVYGVKTGATHYDFFARPPREVNQFSGVDEMMEDYARDLEGMVKKYPAQWFNYYDFWAKADS